MNSWLLIDVGSTHTVAGTYEVSPSQKVRLPLQNQVRFRTRPELTPDEYRAQLIQLFQNRTPLLLGSVDRVIVTTVVPSLGRVILSAFSPLPCLIIKADTRRDFELDIPNPNQMGADRLANIAGALTLVKPPFLIVDAGTATTFCLVDERPAFIGGVIVPGLQTSWSALQQRAPRLPHVELLRPSNTLGNTTETQLQSGAIHGHEALIEGITDRLVAEWKQRHSFHADSASPFLPLAFLATGGCTQTLHLSERFQIEPDLTLLGLIRYGQITQ